jgi:hypothetical protein
MPRSDRRTFHDVQLLPGHHSVLPLRMKQPAAGNPYSSPYRSWSSRLRADRRHGQRILARGRRSRHLGWRMWSGPPATQCPRCDRVPATFQAGSGRWPSRAMPDLPTTGATSRRSTRAAFHVCWSTRARDSATTARPRMPFTIPSRAPRMRCVPAPISVSRRHTCGPRCGGDASASTCCAIARCPWSRRISKCIPGRWHWRGLFPRKRPWGHPTSARRDSWRA